ncbi:MAG: DUF4430 domain-containing protein [Clostridia bacterium]|nr:DUF4430 domain-containing protein [Clostridia bacterium]
MKRTEKTTTFLVLLLVAVLALAGCVRQNPEGDSGTVTDGGTVGEGAHTFAFSVVDAEGNKTVFAVHTDEETVGEALLKNGLIAGDAGAYGLYVKTVNGITLDFEKDGKYWAFYVEGAYAAAGVDATPVTDGADYMFKAE